MSLELKPRYRLWTGPIKVKVFGFCSPTSSEGLNGLCLLLGPERLQDPKKKGENGKIE